MELIFLLPYRKAVQDVSVIVIKYNVLCQTTMHMALYNGTMPHISAPISILVRLTENICLPLIVHNNSGR